MKFSANGQGRKNYFYFKVDYDFYQDGEKALRPWTVSVERRDLDGRVCDFVNLVRTHRFKCREDAQEFCEAIADGKYNLVQLENEEKAARLAHNEVLEAAKLAKLSAFLQEFKAIGVDPMLLPAILQTVYGMDPEIRLLASNSEKIRQCLHAGQKESLFDQISHASARQVFPFLATHASSRTNPEH